MRGLHALLEGKVGTHDTVLHVSLAHVHFRRLPCHLSCRPMCLPIKTKLIPIKSTQTSIKRHLPLLHKSHHNTTRRNSREQFETMPRKLKTSSMAGKARDKILPFKKRPPELRSKIYDLSPVRRERVLVRRQRPTVVNRDVRYPRENQEPRKPFAVFSVLTETGGSMLGPQGSNLLRLNEVIQQEALPVLYGRECFHFWSIASSDVLHRSQASSSAAERNPASMAVELVQVQ